MPLNTLTVTITNPRLIDGFVQAAINNGTTPEALASEFLEQQARSYADLFRIGIITSAEFIRRFTAAEYGAILAAAEQDASVAALVDQLTSSPNVALDDARLLPGLTELAEAGLIEEGRVAELVAYARPEVEA